MMRFLSKNVSVTYTKVSTAFSVLASIWPTFFHGFLLSFFYPFDDTYSRLMPFMPEHHNVMVGQQVEFHEVVDVVVHWSSGVVVCSFEE